MSLFVTREIQLPENYGVLRINLSGPLRPDLGYIVNVTTIDAIVGGVLASKPVDSRSVGGGLVLWLQQNLPKHFPASVRLHAVEWYLHPRVRYSVVNQESPMLTVTCQFEFAAAHRLHVSGLSENENRREFGKCVGLHGHNYVLEVTVAGAADPATGEVYPIDRLQATVKQVVVDRFDHRYLNTDVEEFASLNPTVEHLAIVVGELLKGKFEPAVLERVRIYENPRIWADWCRRAESAGEPQ
jgi:6-pyruvoyltetrahydropterin/6-carboxytetrahydropterin synthase